MNEKTAKSNLRQELRQRLMALSPAFRAQASRQMEAWLMREPLWQSGSQVYAFAPLASEPDLTVWDWSGKSLALPRVTESGLEFFAVSGFDGLELHSMGMGEPPREALRAEPPDWVIVPGLGFDCAGGRLGRGGGYYDRFLATLPPTVQRMGIAFECQLCAAIPQEPHDLVLDGLVTEWGVRFFATPPNSLEAFAFRDHSARASDPKSESRPDKI